MIMKNACINPPKPSMWSGSIENRLESEHDVRAKGSSKKMSSLIVFILFNVLNIT